MEAIPPALDKLAKFLRLEAERGYDNRAVLGGLERMLEPWQAEARNQGIPDALIETVLAGLREYPRLAGDERRKAVHEVLDQLASGSAGAVPHPAGSPSDGGAAAPRTVEEDESPGAEPTPPPAELPGAAPRPLEAPLTAIPGIGPKSAETLSRLGLNTLGDLLWHFPRRYDDYSKLKTINRLWYGEEVTVIGTIEDMQVRPIRGGRMKITEAVIGDGTGSLRATWFNQPWIAERLPAGRGVSLSGRVDQYLGRLVMKDPEWEPLDRQQLHTHRIVPVYPLTEGVSSKWLRRVIFAVVERYAAGVPDPLPAEVREEAELIPLGRAVAQIHFPDDAEQLARAQHRLAFDELFYLQVGVLQQKSEWRSLPGQPLPADDAWIQAFQRGLPYELTGDQHKALADVRADLGQEHPMNRLLQGEVGSGKTVIAAAAIGIAAASGVQSAVLAPTGILAEQHFRTLCDILPKSAGVLPDAIRLLTGATPEAEKASGKAGLADGSLLVAVGTHALLEPDVAFARLGLAVVDEQHRFGVEQRAALRRKGTAPHLLVMTATPIPRSLALTLYGDLDLTVLEEMPPGRKAIETRVLLSVERQRAYTFVRGQLDSGRQAFIIYPLIDESEKVQAKAATAEFDRLQTEVFPQVRLGLLHGRLGAEEKERVMSAFRSGELSVLVSTSVVEVGIDIPNASVMVIEGANRFGLAQLHQFRGRIGRGEHASYCLLIPDTDDEAENARLKALEGTQDGFRLAELDLEQRGPGEFLGTRQSGFAELRLASLGDVRLLEKVRRSAARVLASDPELARPEHRRLAGRLEAFWASRTGERS
jgi:ATP-dependent DNA helicase RecG